MCNIWHAKGENAYEHTKRLFCFKQTWFKIIGLSDDSTLYIFKVWRNLQNRQHTWLKLTLKSDLKSKALLMKCYTFHLRPQISW